MTILAEGKKVFYNFVLELQTNFQLDRTSPATNSAALLGVVQNFLLGGRVGTSGENRP